MYINELYCTYYLQKQRNVAFNYVLSVLEINKDDDEQNFIEEI